jgi:outer membrane protein assembly factor BamB
MFISLKMMDFKVERFRNRSFMTIFINEKTVIFLFCLLAVAIPGVAAGDSDWPMWRYDAARSASSPSELPKTIQLLWMNQYPARIQVWDDPLNQDLMPYDRVFEPVVSGKTLLLGFNDSDKLAALDTETGNEKWHFYVDGPVRLPPVVWKDKVYFNSDDGCLYCLNIRDGVLAWRFSGAPREQRILGNNRLISTWPARGGAVVKDGVVYFAAGIWPFMGVFIYALDAGTGKILWINDGEGARYMLQPHNAPAFAGIAPQGALAVAGDRLIVPGGRSVPACFDIQKGKFLYYELAANGKSGGSFVAAGASMFFNHTREKATALYSLNDGRELLPQAGMYPVIGRNAVYFSGIPIRAFAADWAGKTLDEWGVKGLDLKKRSDAFVREFKAKSLWETEADASGDLIRAGNRLYAAGKGTITALELPPTGGKPSIAWKKKVNASVERLIAADGKLFAVTLDGRVMAFGEKKKEAIQRSLLPSPSEPARDETQKAQDIISASGISEGYTLAYGARDADFLESLAGSSGLRIIAVENDRSQVEAMRRRFDRNGLAGGKISVFEGDFSSFATPPYMSSLTILAIPNLISTLKKESLSLLYQSLRPYGGTLLIPYSAEAEKVMNDLLDKSGLYSAKLKKSGNFLFLVREGALSGAGVWTHTLGNIANTSKSDDSLVKLPLGLLWFGGSSNQDVLPRHAHGPSEQVVGGRLFIEGIDCLSARDVYTGRVLWKTMLRDFETYGVYYDKTYRGDIPTSTEYNQVHIPGSNIRGTNFVAADDRVYAIQRDGCHVLDPATGKTLSVFTFPPDTTKAKGYVPEWGYIGVYKDFLIAGRDFVPFSDILMKKKGEYTPQEDFDRSASRSLIVMNRFTGKILWQIYSEIGFLHNGAAVGNGRIFLLDTYPPYVGDLLSRRGKTVPSSGRLLSIDITTGKPVWEDRKNVFGSFLAYSGENDILIQSMRPTSDQVLGETGKRLRSVKGTSGEMIWDKTVGYRTFPIIHNDRIITESGALSLMTGEPVMRTDPITGANTAWSWKREYGCNYPVACENLLSFRSGAAGFYDLVSDSGTGNFGGFKSGCSANLIAADGVLNAPDYTRTCSCAYQNQTSLAMVSMPQNEMWTYCTLGTPKGPIERLGINLGAPGDRASESGTLWLEYPLIGGPSPEIPIAIEPKNAEYYRFHSSRILGGELPWVGASGCLGARKITVSLSKTASPGTYSVRLVFAEPEELKSGKRIFDVLLMGQPVVRNLDIVKEAGGNRRTLVKEFRNIKIEKDLTVEFNSASGENMNPPVISGIEIVRNK